MPSPHACFGAHCIQRGSAAVILSLPSSKTSSSSLITKDKVSQSHSQRDVQNMGLAYRRLFQSILGAAIDKQTLRQSDRRFLSTDQ